MLGNDVYVPVYIDIDNMTFSLFCYQIFRYSKSPPIVLVYIIIIIQLDFYFFLFRC